MSLDELEALLNGKVIPLRLEAPIAEPSPETPPNTPPDGIAPAADTQYQSPAKPGDDGMPKLLNPEIEFDPGRVARFHARLLDPETTKVPTKPGILAGWNMPESINPQPECCNERESKMMDVIFRRDNRSL